MECRFQPKQGRLRDWLMSSGHGAPTIIGGGGAKGGGKSGGIRNTCLHAASEIGNAYPGFTITIVRRVYEDLKNNHIDKFFEAHPELRSHYSADAREITLSNKAKIKFAYAETPADVERKFRGGFESPWVLVDEAQQFTERELQDIEMAARWTQASVGLPPNFCKLGLFFNPGGKSSDKLRRIFWAKQYTGNENPANYRFMHMFGWDNYEWFRGQVDIGEVDFYDMRGMCAAGPDAKHHVGRCCRYNIFINETSEGRKYNAFPKAIRQGLLLGSFDDFEGQYFAGAWSNNNIITESMAQEIIQPWWTRWMAQDWGFGDHTSHGWYASGMLKPLQWMKHFGGHTEWPMTVVVRYREYLEAGVPEIDQANAIVRHTPPAERRAIQRFFLSEDAMGKRAKQSGEHTVGQQYTAVMREHNLPAPEPALQDRINGFRFMYNCVWQANLRGTNISKERAEAAPVFLVSAECPNAATYIPQAIRAEKDIEDVERVAGAVWEDVTDEIRYGLMSMLGAQWQAPVEVRRQEVYDTYNVPMEERTGPQMTSLALAVRRFDAEESSRYKRVRRRR